MDVLLVGRRVASLVVQMVASKDLTMVVMTAASLVGDWVASMVVMMAVSRVEMWVETSACETVG